jgi:hypothetical protein
MVRVEVFEHGAGVAESTANGAKDSREARLLFVKNYRYGVVLGVHFG